MNELKVFNNPEFGQVRTMSINGEPYFVGKDVAEILGYSNTRDALAKRVDDEDKGVAKCDTLGGTQELTIINESGLYSLILSSKLPNAKKFKRWVTSEVLPSIRQNGRYSVDTHSDEVLTVRDVVVITTEVIKALLPALQQNTASVTVNNIYNGRRGKHSKVDRLPYTLRLAVEEMLLNEYITYNEVADFLSSKGFDITDSSLQRHAARLRKEQK